jgi:hypothetical protein
MMSNSEASQAANTDLITPTKDPIAAAIIQFENIKEALSGPKRNDSEVEKKKKTWVLPAQDPKTDASKP